MTNKTTEALRIELEDLKNLLYEQNEVMIEVWKVLYEQNEVIRTLTKDLSNEKNKDKMINYFLYF